MLVDPNNKSLAGASKQSMANSGGKRLNKKVVLELGKYNSRKSQADTARKKKIADEKKAQKAAQKERAAVAKKLIGKKKGKPAAKSKKPASQKKAKPKVPVFDSSEEDSSDEDDH